MADLTGALQAAAGTAASAGGAADPNFNQTVLLLHGDGTNGAQNNTFLDSSSNTFTITRNGNTTQGTFSPFSLAAGQWSNAFDGSGDYFTVPDNAALDLSATSWTIECWFYIPSGVTGIKALITKWATGQRSYYLSANATTRVIYTSLSNDGSTNIDHSSSTNAWEFDQWNHVAWTFGSSTRTIWVNGVDVGSTAYALAIHSGSSSVSVGAVATTGNMIGYISNLRVVNGREVYTSAFTPPTSPLGATSGGEDPPQGTETALLTCQSNRFVDNSTNGFTLTPVGNVAVQPFSPFAPSAAYSASVNGGSGYFDGVSDNLTFPNSAAVDFSGEFCVEFFIYLESIALDTLQPSIVTFPNQPSQAQIYINSTSGYFAFYSGAANVVATANSSATLNTWHHLVVCRDGSNNTSIFLNGSRAATAVSSTNWTASATGTWRLMSYDGSQGDVKGYLSNCRFVCGDSVYDPTSTTLTVPTSPLTAITDTEFLLNFTNAGIFDNTGKNNLETVGNAQVDTATKKYGTGAMEFDGTGDWLKVPNSVDIQLRTGDFTIEFWVYLATGDTGSNRGLVAKGGASTGWLVSLNTTEKVVFTYTTSTITSSGAITLDAWNHIAVVREGTGSNETKIYINGTNDGTGTVSTDFNQTEVMYIGANRAAGDPMKGYIDDLRITKGVARYTTTFTPPTAAFPDL